MKVSHTAIAVRDLEESVKFYIDVLGFKQVRRFSPQEGVTIVYLQGETDAMVELIEGVDRLKMKLDSGNALILIGLEVTNIDQTKQEFQTKGVNLIDGPIDAGNGVRIAFLKDPNGVVIELVEHN